MSVLPEAPSSASARRSRPSPSLAAALLAVATLVAVIGAVLAVGGSGGTEAAATTRTVTVKRGVVQSTVSGSGTLAAARDRELAFSSAGTVEDVLVGAGDRVVKGQVLARLETSDGTTKRLRAPFAGTIASVGVGEGDTVGGASSSSAQSAGGGSSSDTTTAFELVSLEAYDMTVSLSESDIGKVEKGQAATVTVAATGDELAARVKHVSLLPASSSSDTSGASSSSSSAVSYSVTLELTQSAADLKPGMSSSADIVTAETTGLTVPTAALRGNQVTVVAGGKKTATQVQTGTPGDSVTEIVSGLKAGQTVQVTSVSAAAGASSSSDDDQDSDQQGNRAGGFGGFNGGGPPGGGAGGPPGGGFGG